MTVYQYDVVARPQFTNSQIAPCLIETRTQKDKYRVPESHVGIFLFLSIFLNKKIYNFRQIIKRLWASR